MSRLVEVEQLLAEISADHPCGPDLEHAPEYQALDQAATGKPERQVGQTVIPAEEPDWNQVRSRATALLGQAKDLRVAVKLVRALVHLGGYAGLHDGLTLV